MHAAWTVQRYRRVRTRALRLPSRGRGYGVGTARCGPENLFCYHRCCRPGRHSVGAGAGIGVRNGSRLQRVYLLVNLALLLNTDG